MDTDSDPLSSRLYGTEEQREAKLKFERKQLEEQRRLVVAAKSDKKKVGIYYIYGSFSEYRPK